MILTVLTSLESEISIGPKMLRFASMNSSKNFELFENTEIAQNF